MNTTVSEDFRGEFRVRFEYSDTWCDVTAWEIIGHTEPDKKIIFNRRGHLVSPDPVENEADAEEYLSGFVKWDGCSEFDLGTPHFCGPDSYRKHFALLEHIYRRAQQLMPKGNWEPWDEGDASTVGARR